MTSCVELINEMEMDKCFGISTEIKNFLAEHFTIDINSLDVHDKAIYLSLTPEEQKQLLKEVFVDIAGVTYPKLAISDEFRNLFDWAEKGILTDKLAKKMDSLRKIVDTTVKNRLSEWFGKNSIFIEYEVNSRSYFIMEVLPKADMPFIFTVIDYSDDTYISIDGTIKPFVVYDQNRFVGVKNSQHDIDLLTTLFTDLIRKGMLLIHIEDETFDELRKKELQRLFNVLYLQ